MLYSCKLQEKVSAIFCIIGIKDKEEILSIEHWANTNLRFTELLIDLLHVSDLGLKFLIITSKLLLTSVKPVNQLFVNKSYSSNFLKGKFIWYFWFIYSTNLLNE